MQRLVDAPLIVSLMGLGAVSMLVPALHALLIDDHPTSRAFLYPALLFFILFIMVALATTGMRIRRQGRSHLISIFGCLVALPVMLAVPFSEAVPDTRFLNAYVEMVSSLTTTGLTLFEPDRLPPSVHLWRALVGWMGGFFIWVIAGAILAPLNLGGFEVTSDSEIGQGARQASASVENAVRLRRTSARLLPIYVSLTLVLWLALFMIGDTPLVALCHAMSTLSTSGISPVGGLEGGVTEWRGEVIIMLFFVFALSRLTFVREERAEGWLSLWKDPELRLGILICVAVAGVLFLRHWMVSFDDALEVPFVEGLRALWGALFTVMSFLTTTGFVSGDWEVARAWSGLGAPSVLLLGLAVFGGGVATTAGGVKLLRVFALYQHSVREMEKLVQPSSIGGAGKQGRRFRRQGAFAAWVFFMLFAVSIALVMMGFSLIGVEFEEAMILTISSLSTTGPLVEVAGSSPVELSALGDAARILLAGAMVIGRLEALALIAFLNPEFWR